MAPSEGSDLLATNHSHSCSSTSRRSRYTIAGVLIITSVIAAVMIIGIFGSQADKAHHDSSNTSSSSTDSKIQTTSDTSYQDGLSASSSSSSSPSSSLPPTPTSNNNIKPVATTKGGNVVNPTNPITSALASQLDNLVGQGALTDKAEGSSDLTLKDCTPKDGPGLKQLVEASSCPIIPLIPHVRYTLPDEIAVRRRVLVVGRPLGLSTIDATGCYRAFKVYSDGYLDLRFVRIFRGHPMETVKPNLLLELRGGSVWIKLGGVGVFTGVLFTTSEALIQEFGITVNPQTTVRFVGGHIFLEAGILRLMDCHFWISRPGVLFREVWVVGGDVLVLSGDAVVTGCTFTATFLFANVIAAGNFVAVLGGTAIFTGTLFTLSGAFIIGSGSGLLVFLGGGVIVLTGCVAEGNLVFLAFFGAGVGLFIGGGVAILTGVVYDNVIVAAMGAGLGFNNALGSGVMIKTGVTQTTHVIINMVAVLGVATYIGSGMVVYVGTIWSRESALAAYYGAGGSLFVGAGTVIIVNSFSFSFSAIAFVGGAGADHFVAAGWMTIINAYFFKYSVVIAFYGQGANTCLVAGAALLVNVRFGVSSTLVDVNRGFVNIYIAGNAIDAINYNSVIVLATHHFVVAIDKEGNKRVYGREYLEAQKNIIRMRNVYFEDFSAEDWPQIVKNRPNPASLRHRTLKTVPIVRTVRATAVANNASSSSSSTSDNNISSSISNDSSSSRNSTIIEGATRSSNSTGSTSDSSLIEGPAPTNLTISNDSWIPAWPGSAIKLPPLPPGTNTNVYLASAIDSCQACDVKPGLTSEHFEGEGLNQCTFQEACNDEDQPMWSQGLDGSLPNTTVAIMDLSTIYNKPSPSTVISLSSAAVLLAVNQTIDALDLPQRLHLRVVAVQPTDTDPLFVEKETDDDYRGSGDVIDGGGGGGAEVKQCSEALPFKAYLVGDSQQIITQVVNGLKTSKAGTVLTSNLKALVDPDILICQLKVVSSVSMFIPSNIEAQSFKPTSIDNDDSLLLVDGLPSAALLSTIDGSRIYDVVPGDSYALSLQNFPKVGLLSIRLMSSRGTGIVVGVVPSRPDEVEGKQTWTWVVSKAIKPGDYYLQVTSTGGQGGSSSGENGFFAYSQAFGVIEG